MKWRLVYWFWGILDLLYVVRFILLEFIQGKIPFYSDAQIYFYFTPNFDIYSLAKLFLGFAFNLSVMGSAVLFICGSRWVPRVVYVQTPIRFLLGIPSLPIFAPASVGAGAGLVVFFVIYIVLVEVLKVASVFFRSRASKV